MTFLRRTVAIGDAQCTTSLLAPAQALPLVMTPTFAGTDLARWGSANRALIDSRLSEHGGLLLRGFSVPDVAAFEAFVAAVGGELLAYTERSSPRTGIQGRIYTSTDHPPDQEIFLHNEQSYNLTFPSRIAFFCLQPAADGGETPICDCRNVYERVPPAIRARFAEHGYLYVRNFGGGFGLPWQTAFQTEDPAQVEAYCRARRITCEWRADGRLQTRQVRRTTLRHPRTGAATWFNHATFFHLSTLEPGMRQTLLQLFGGDDLPNHTYYGDGTPIADEVMDVLRAAYLSERVVFPWQTGDVLLLDNLLTAHARRPFRGARRVAVGMAAEIAWDDVEDAPR